MSWKQEISDPVSPIVQEQTIGISEAFNIRVDEVYSAGDYLYYFGGIDDLWLGLWGIIRAHKCIQRELLPLCREQNLPPPKEIEPPKEAVVRKFSVAAIQKKLVYNSYGDHDPNGLLFVPLERIGDVISGKERPIPLILRVNAGDWIEVTLYNMFDPNCPIEHFDYPSVPLEYPHKPSDRVSLNPQFLKYDPIQSSGINVGYNEIEQTAAPGEKIRYLWYADKEYGACIINSFGDVRNHRYHGLFGTIIIEPPKAVWFDGLSCRDKHYGEQAVVASPGEEAFREFVLFAQNGIRMLDKNGVLIKTTEMDTEEGAHGAPDHEDTGEKGYNYRSERFINRLMRDPRMKNVFSSKEHGDPATPLFKAYEGERIVFRYLMPGDKPRNISFVLHGHQWKAQPKDPFSRVVSVQGAVSVGGSYRIEPENGAAMPGDYLYRSGSLRWDVESGMWGILRIMKRSLKCYCENICRRIVKWWK